MSKRKVYKKIMGYKCANPNCNSNINIHTHHIYPCSLGGPDSYWNLITLCGHCHGKFENKDNDEELYLWKCQQEISRFGFVLDDRENDFKKNIKKARKIPCSINKVEIHYKETSKDSSISNKNKQTKCSYCGKKHNNRKYCSQKCHFEDIKENSPKNKFKSLVFNETIEERLRPIDKSV